MPNKNWRSVLREMHPGRGGEADLYKVDFETNRTLRFLDDHIKRLEPLRDALKGEIMTDVRSRQREMRSSSPRRGLSSRERPVGAGTAPGYRQGHLAREAPGTGRALSDKIFQRRGQVFAEIDEEVGTLRRARTLLRSGMLKERRLGPLLQMARDAVRKNARLRGPKGMLAALAAAGAGLLTEPSKEQQ